MQSFRVLLIEDSVVQAQLIQGNLENVQGSHFEVMIAECVKAGGERLAEDRFDAVLLDLMLPDSDGIDTFFSRSRLGW